MKTEPRRAAFWQLLRLHMSILVFSLTGIFSKMAANTINDHGVFHIMTFVWLGLMVLNCAVYALAWQQNLKTFDINVAYAHRAVYNVWSLLWALLVFSETLTLGNILGTVLIIAGVVVIERE